MAFTFLPNIPAATDLISSSQSEIQENFQYLGDTTGNAVAGYYKFPNGLMVAWGNEGGPFPADGSDFLSANIPPPIALSAIYSVYLTPRIGDATSKRFVVDSVTPPSVTGFKIRTSTNAFDTIYWLIIGLV